MTAQKIKARSSGAEACGFPTFVRTMGSSSSGSRCAAFAASVSPQNSATVQGSENEASIEARREARRAGSLSGPWRNQVWRRAMNALALSFPVAARRDAHFTLVRPRRETMLQPRRRRLVCRWRKDPQSGRLLCIWSEDGVEASRDGLRPNDCCRAE
jgi:hypothetical protein